MYAAAGLNLIKKHEYIRGYFESASNQKAILDLNQDIKVKIVLYSFRRKLTRLKFINWFKSDN